MHIVAAFSLDTWNLPHEVTIISLGAHGRPRTTLTFDLSQGPTAFLRHAALIRDEADPGTAHIVDAAEAHAALQRLPDSRQIIDWFEQWQVLNVSLTPQSYAHITNHGHLSSQALAVAAHQQLSSTPDSGPTGRAWPGPQQSFDDSLFSEANRKAAVQAATDGAQAVGNTVQQGFNSLLAHLAKAQLRAAMTPPEVRQPATQWADWARTVTNEWFPAPPSSGNNSAPTPTGTPHGGPHQQPVSTSWTGAGSTTVSAPTPETVQATDGGQTTEATKPTSASTGSVSTDPASGGSAYDASSRDATTNDKTARDATAGTATGARANDSTTPADHREADSDTKGQTSGQSPEDAPHSGSHGSTRPHPSTDDGRARQAQQERQEHATGKPAGTASGEPQDTISQAWQIVDDVTDWATTQRLTDTFWSFVGTLNNTSAGQGNPSQAEDHDSAWKNTTRADRPETTDGQ